MSIPPRRNRMTRLSLFTGPVLMAAVILALLIAANYFLKAKSQVQAVDTLTVTAQGLALNGKSISLTKLSQHYRKDNSARRLQVEVANDLPWGKTWELRDTLAEIARKRPKLVITGLD